MSKTKSPMYIDGVLQLPVIRLEGGPRPGTPVTRGEGWHTGIRCPRCCSREIVYNGNYFCRGFGLEDRECGWALPNTLEPPYTEPHHVALMSALIRSQRSRS